MRGSSRFDDALVLDTSASSASSTARACGPYLVNTSRLRTLSARSRRVSGGLVEGDVADQVEGIEVLAHFLGERIERQALGRQFLDDRLLALGRLPALEEIVEAGEALPERLLGEVAQALGDELAVFVEILDPLGDDAWRRRHRRRSCFAFSPPGGMVMSGGSPSTIDFVRRRARAGWRLRRPRRWAARRRAARSGRPRRARRSAPARRRNRGRRSGWSRRGSRSG